MGIEHRLALYAGNLLLYVTERALFVDFLCINTGQWTSRSCCSQGKVLHVFFSFCCSTSISIFPSSYTDNLVNCASLIVWYQFRRHFKLGLSDIFEVKLETCSLLAIVGVSPDPHHLNRHTLMLLPPFARRRILLDQTSPQPPSTSLWFKDIIFFLNLKKVKFTLQGSTNIFFKYCKPLIEYTILMLFCPY